MVGLHRLQRPHLHQQHVQGERDNVKYIMEVLGMKILKQKRRDVGARE
jgi:hypothetical protein